MKEENEMTLTFYTNPMSRGQIARWALHEAGTEYEQVLLDYNTTMKADDYLQINPMGKVPAIVHDGKVVTEGAAICAYLAEMQPNAGLAPTEDERADYYRWMFYAAGPLETAISNNSLGFNVNPEQERTVGYGSYDQVIDVLDRKFSTDDYVCGERFTMADVYVGAQIIWGTLFGTIAKRESFLAYTERLTARDAYLKAKAIDDALIAEIENQ
ncbi:MAG: glutathione S-transferase family protein [Parasphingorhabdus sp.]